MFSEADESRDFLPQGEKGPSGKADCCWVKCDSIEKRLTSVGDSNRSINRVDG